MFLNLGHTKLPVYLVTRKFVQACYLITSNFPIEEKFELVRQIQRAAISVQLNLAEGCSRKSPHERRRYFEIARGSVVEIDSAMDIAGDLHYLNSDSITEFENAINDCFQQLSNLIRANSIEK